MRRVIINGANGYVASNLISKLLKKGYEVIAFVRGTTDLKSEERMKNALADVDNTTPLENLSVFDYSLHETNYSLSEERLDTIFQGDVDFLHFAACLKFKSRDRDEIFKTNVEGVKNSVGLFSAHATKNSRFFYISTVYSCGKTIDVFKEEFYENAAISEFRNYYEQSKRFAENAIREYIENNELKAHIIRLSQVVGDRKSGITKTNYGIFDFIKKMQVFSANYPNERIRVQINPDATQNLIPIDTVVDYFVKALRQDNIPTIINFAARKPVKNDIIIGSVCDLLPVDIIQEEKLERDKLNKYERMILAGMSFTGEYAATNMKFDTKNLEKIVSPNGHEISAGSLHKMIKYFVEFET